MNNVNVLVTGKGSKRKSQFQELQCCNLCSSKKLSSMIQCNGCKQWQHSRCVGIALKEYDDKFKCMECKQGQRK